MTTATILAAAIAYCLVLLFLHSVRHLAINGPSRACTNNATMRLNDARAGPARSTCTGPQPGLHWRNVPADEDFLRAWLNACIDWNPWVMFDVPQPLVNRQITVTTQETLAVAALYCHLGEQLQGWRGYVGQDLDGFGQFLRLANQAELAALHVQVLGAAQVRAQLQRASGHASYFDAWLRLLHAHGVRVSLA